MLGKNMILVLIGPHGSGKTTLGKMLAERFGIPFHHEIGRYHREIEQKKSDGTHAANSETSFDRIVMEEEFARDILSRGPRIIETWHPGNLAYAAMRNRDVYLHYMAILKTFPFTTNQPVLIQPLRVDSDTLLLRLNERGPLEKLLSFFVKVGVYAEWMAQRMPCTVLPPLSTDNESPENTAIAIERSIRLLNKR